MSQQKNNHLHYREALEIVNGLKDIHFALMGIVSDYPSLRQKIIDFSLRNYAFLLPLFDAEILLELYSALGKLLIYRYEHHDLPPISNDAMIEHISTICKFNESIVSNWRVFLSDCPESIIQSLNRLFDVVKDKNIHK